MEFEDILKDVGGFGLYQKTLVIIFFIPFFISDPWYYMNAIFNVSTPDHWCYVLEVSNSNLTLDLQKQLIRPPQDCSCLMYDVNYSQIPRSGNLTVDKSWPTKSCIDGWQYDTNNYIATAVTRWNMVCNNRHYSSLVFSLIFFGSLCGVPVYSFFSDRVGRKPVIFFQLILIAVTELGSTFSPYFTLFLVLKGINGSAAGYTFGYLILLEIVSPEYRSRISAVSTTVWTIGLCLLSLTAWLSGDWVRLSIVTSIVATVFLLYWKVVPESPRWLITQKRYEEAHEILAKMSKINGRDAHKENQLMEKIEQLDEKMKKQTNDVKDTALDLFRYPTLRKRFLLMIFCWMGNSLIYYGLQVNVTNLAGNEFLNFFLLSVAEIPSHLLCWFCMERIGRRWSTVFAFLTSATACLMPVVFPPDFMQIGLVASVVAKFSSSFVFMAQYQFFPELLPTSLRGLGIGICSSIGTGSTLLAPYIIYLANFRTYISFLIFSVICLFSAVCASFLPETLNKNLPQTVLDSENFSKKFKYFSCYRYKKSDSELETIERVWSPVKLSKTGPKSSKLKEPVSDIPVLINFNLIKLEPNFESSLHM